MESLDRILRNYRIFLAVLKFALKNDDNVEFKRFSLVDTLNQLLRELEERIDKIFPNSMESKPLSYEVLLKSIFKENGVVDDDELEEYKPYINSSNKRELIRRFEFLMDLTDSSSDMWDGAYSIEVNVIDDEIRRIMTFLQPLLVIMSNLDSDILLRYRKSPSIFHLKDF